MNAKLILSNYIEEHRNIEDAHVRKTNHAETDSYLFNRSKNAICASFGIRTANRLLLFFFSKSDSELNRLLIFGQLSKFFDIRSCPQLNSSIPR